MHSETELPKISFLLLTFTRVDRAKPATMNRKQEGTECHNNDVVISTDETVGGSNVTASKDDNGCMDAVKSSSTGSNSGISITDEPGTGPGKACPPNNVARCCDGPPPTTCNKGSSKCVVRQKSAKIVLAASSEEDHIYHIYGK